MRSKKRRLTPLACAGLGAGLALAAGLGAVAKAQDTLASEIAASNEVASRLDPEGYSFVQPVCTRCHTASTFLHSRRWTDWQRTFSRMAGNGAMAAPEQWGHIYGYFRKSLTLLYVNAADEDELSEVLGVDEQTAILIVQRRVDRRFEDAADLETVPGVDKAMIEGMKPRLLFEPLQRSG